MAQMIVIIGLAEFRLMAYEPTIFGHRRLSWH